MAGFKIMTWNVEWLVDAFDVATGAQAPHSRRGGRRMPSQEQAVAKLDGIGREIGEIDPDIALLVEAIPDPDRMREFVTAHLPGYVLIEREGAPKSAYATLGEQWLWFVTKPEIKAAYRAELLDIKTWQAYTAKVYADQDSRRQLRPGYWWLSCPKIDNKTRVIGANTLVEHTHYRHPQVLVIQVEGMRVEFIGVHLKSKFTGVNVPKRGADEKDKAYYDRDDVKYFMAKSVVARAKLTTEATDVRNYIDQRFQQESLPAIFVMGDANDGPGKELLEREYMLHDLIGNLQGDVFFARQFLNHALFDNQDDLRWTVEFKDALDPRRSPHILLDHILFTEALSRRGLGPLLVKPYMGRVEHEIHDRIASLMPARAAISDHRPISLVVSERATTPAPTG